MRPSATPAPLSRRTCLGWLGAIGAAGPAAAALPPLAADALARFRVALPVELHGLAGRVRQAEVALATPPAFDAARAWPVLVVSATSDAGHQSSRALMAAYRSAAAAAGWVALSADPDVEVAPADDTLTLRFALVSVALALVRPLWREADRAPLAFAGFSGGAKYAGWLAALCARERRRVAGIFLSGVNEDPVHAAAKQVGVLDDAFRRTPVFLQAGRDDAVAPPERHREILDLLQRRGFDSTRLEFVDGGHRVDATWLPQALAWFAAREAAPR